MSTLRTISFSFLVTCLTVPARSAPVKADLDPAPARAGVLQKAEQMLAPPTYINDIKSDLKNPFSPNMPVVKSDNKSLRPASDRDFLIILANQLNPTGVLMLGEDSFLMFGEKKVKVSDSIRIPFDNQYYDVELVDLSRTSFTVRFNTEQITRPIKPAKAP